MFTAGRFFFLPDAFLSTDGWKIFTEPGQKYLCIGLLLGDYQLAQALCRYHLWNYIVVPI